MKKALSATQSTKRAKKGSLSDHGADDSEHFTVIMNTLP